MGQKIYDFYQSEAPNQIYIHFQGVDREQEVGVVQCGHMKTASSYGYGPMIRDHYLVHFVESGRGRLFLHDHVYEVGAGSCFLIHPHQIAYYEADSADPWEYYWVGLCGYRAESLLGEAGLTYERFVVPLPTDGSVFRTLGEMIAAVSQRDVGLFLDGMLRVLLYRMARGFEEIGVKGADLRTEPSEMKRLPGGHSEIEEEYVRIIMSVIQTSYQENISIERIAERMGLNRSYLTSIFHRHVGVSIRTFLTEYRVERAAVLLRNKARSIASVASEVGFTDPLHFSKVFARYKGASPRDYRRMSI
jgi:AraC-like DNA-binding protein